MAPTPSRSHSDAPDVILLDLRMPRMAAPEFCWAYRERGGQARIIIVAAVPSATDEIAQCQADDLIAKPFPIEAVIAAVERQASRLF